MKPIVLYGTSTNVLQSEEFHYSLWPGAISRSGRAGYMKRFPSSCNHVSFIFRYGREPYPAPAVPVMKKLAKTIRKVLDEAKNKDKIMKEVQRRLQIFIILFCIVTLIGTIGFMILEKLSFTDAFYYNIVTMSTVGYGDIHPTRQASRMLAVLLIVMGGASFLGVIANTTEILILKREAQTRIKKLNMVLGIFFTETGYKLLKLFSNHDNINSDFKKNLIVDFNWTDERFATAMKTIKKHKVKIDLSDLDLKELKVFLGGKRDFLLGLLENPVLIEHEDFSDSLLSVFHVLDELSNRNNLHTLPEPDIKHLANDMNRAYKNLIMQWLTYMKHLKKEYPYLFSLAMRTNPFNKNASPVIFD